MLYDDNGLKKRNDSDLMQTQGIWMAQHRAVWGISRISPAEQRYAIQLCGFLCERDHY